MARPDKTLFTGASVTEGGFKTAHDQLIDWLDVLLGAVDDYIKVARGTDVSRPAATEGGWLRWNTDNSTLDISIASALWHKVVTSIIDATWKLRFDFNSASLALFKSTAIGNIATVRVENNSGDFVEVERTADFTIVRSSGTDPIKFYIGATAVLSVDSSGNVIALGNITANGTP
jgi:hypothetical protein